MGRKSLSIVGNEEISVSPPEVRLGAVEEGAALSVSPGKVGRGGGGGGGVGLGGVGGGDCPAEVYGDLWPLPQHLIASSSVGSRGRPTESF